MRFSLSSFVTMSAIFYIKCSLVVLFARVLATPVFVMMNMCGRILEAIGRTKCGFDGSAEIGSK